MLQNDQKDTGKKMKVDFDKFTKSQKVYSVIGVVLAILIYMYDAENLNFSIGLVLLTAIFVFLLRYKLLRNTVNITVGIALLFVAVWLSYAFLPGKIMGRLVLT